MTGWATIVFGPEQGAALDARTAEALGEALDRTPLHLEPKEYPVNPRQIAEVSAAIDAGLTQDDLDDMTEAERLGLVVAAAYGNALAERDLAHQEVVRLRERLAEAERLLEQAAAPLDASTWATDGQIASSIQAFLQAVDSTQAPTQED